MVSTTAKKNDYTVAKVLGLILAGVTGLAATILHTVEQSVQRVANINAVFGENAAYVAGRYRDVYLTHETSFQINKAVLTLTTSPIETKTVDGVSFRFLPDKITGTVFEADSKSENTACMSFPLEASRPGHSVIIGRLDRCWGNSTLKIPSV
jgi:hypothetical protein